MNGKASFIVLILLLGFELHSVTSVLKNGKDDFKIRISEKGIRFKEKIIVNEKDNTVSFVVPAHKGVDRSDVLNDFNFNITVTRLPRIGVCEVRPLDRTIPNPKKMEADMNSVRRRSPNVHMEPGTLVSSSKWALDKEMKPEDSPPSVQKFCRGFRTYRLKEVTEDNWDVEQDEIYLDSYLEPRTPKTFTSCESSIQAKCDPNSWILRCKFVLSTTCVYWAECKTPIGLSNNLENCDLAHNWSSVMCCTPYCP